MAPSDLERRRRAIADALREAMAAPSLSRTSTWISAESHDSVDSHSDLDHSYPTDPDDGVEERASVPPLERVEAMSEHASRALFGHR